MSVTAKHSGEQQQHGRAPESKPQRPRQNHGLRRLGRTFGPAALLLPWLSCSWIPSITARGTANVSGCLQGGGGTSSGRNGELTDTCSFASPLSEQQQRGWPHGLRCSPAAARPPLPPPPPSPPDPAVSISEFENPKFPLSLLCLPLEFFFFFFPPPNSTSEPPVTCPVYCPYCSRDAPGELFARRAMSMSVKTLSSLADKHGQSAPVRSSPCGHPPLHTHLLGGPCGPGRSALAAWAEAGLRPRKCLRNFTACTAFDNLGIQLVASGRFRLGGGGLELSWARVRHSDHSEHAAGQRCW